jgi:hypothetical protein
MSADHGNSFGIFSMDMVLKRIFRLSWSYWSNEIL